MRKQKGEVASSRGREQGNRRPIIAPRGTVGNYTLRAPREPRPRGPRMSHTTAVAIIARLGWVGEGMYHAEHAWRQLAVEAQSRYSRDTVAIQSRYSRDLGNKAFSHIREKKGLY